MNAYGRETEHERARVKNLVKREQETEEHAVIQLKRAESVSGMTGSAERHRGNKLRCVRLQLDSSDRPTPRFTLLGESEEYKLMLECAEPLTVTEWKRYPEELLVTRPANTLAERCVGRCDGSN